MPPRGTPWSLVALRCRPPAPEPPTITFIGDARYGLVPMLAITGQVGSRGIGTDAFQEADIVGATMPFCQALLPHHPCRGHRPVRG